MTNEKLYEVLGDISEKHAAEAHMTRENKKPYWLGAMAACLCLIVVGASVLLKPNSEAPITGGIVTPGIEGMYSVAVYPETDSEENVASAEVVSLSENEALGNLLAEHLPKHLPDGFHYGRGSVYNTVMKDGTQYNMLRIEYITGEIPEQQFTEDGGAVVPHPETIGDVFRVCVMNFEPKTDINIYSSSEEITVPMLEEYGAVYIRSGDCYVGVFTETAEPSAVMDALSSIEE